MLSRAVVGYTKRLALEDSTVYVSALEYRTAAELLQGQQPEPAVNITESEVGKIGKIGLGRHAGTSSGVGNASAGTSFPSARTGNGIRRDSMAGHGRRSVKTTAQRTRQMSSMASWAAGHVGGRDELVENADDDDYDQSIFVHPDELLPDFHLTNVASNNDSGRLRPPSRVSASTAPTLPVRRRAATTGSSVPTSPARRNQGWAGGKDDALGYDYRRDGVPVSGGGGAVLLDPDGLELDGDHRTSASVLQGVPSSARGRADGTPPRPRAATAAPNHRTAPILRSRLQSNGAPNAPESTSRGVAGLGSSDGSEAPAYDFVELLGPNAGNITNRVPTIRLSGGVNGELLTESEDLDYTPLRHGHGNYDKRGNGAGGGREERNEETTL